MLSRPTNFRSNQLDPPLSPLHSSLLQLWPIQETTFTKSKPKAVPCHHLVDFMLKEDGIQLKYNYSHDKLMRGLLEKDKGFKDVISTLETCCKDLKLKHQQEIEGRVKTLDISH